MPKNGRDRWRIGDWQEKLSPGFRMEWAGCDHLVGRLEGLSALAIEWVMRSWVENELAGERVACKEPDARGGIGRRT